MREDKRTIQDVLLFPGIEESAMISALEGPREEAIDEDSEGARVSPQLPKFGKALGSRGKGVLKVLRRGG